MPTFAVFMIRRAIIVVRNIYKQKKTGKSIYRQKIDHTDPFNVRLRITTVCAYAVAADKKLITKRAVVTVHGSAFNIFNINCFDRYYRLRHPDRVFHLRPHRFPAELLRRRRFRLLSFSVRAAAVRGKPLSYRISAYIYLLCYR